MTLVSAILSVALALPLSASGLSGQREALGGTPELDQAWESAMSRLLESDYATAQAHLSLLVTERKRLGIPNLFGMSDVLLRHARKAADSGLSAEASALVDAAEALAPWNPTVPLVRSELADSGLGESFTAMQRSLRLSLLHLPSRTNLIGRAAAVGLLTLLWAVVLFGGLMLLRHGPRLAHDAGHLLPAAMRGVPLAVTGLVALIVAPLVVGVGLVLMSLVWCVILWAYLSNAERVVGALLAGLVALTPTINGHFAASLAVADSPETRAYECTHGRCSSYHRTALVEAANAETIGPMDAETLALVYKRQGSALDQSILTFKAARLLERRLEEAEPSYAAALNFANVRFARENYECRRLGREPDFHLLTRLYKEAASRAPADGGVEVAYNQGVLLAQQGFTDKAQAAIARAGTIDPARVRSWQLDAGPVAGADDVPATRCPLAFNANIMLMDVLPDPVALGRAAVERARAAVADTGATAVPLLAPFGYLLAGITDAGVMPLIGIVCAGLLLLGGLLVTVLRPAYHCAECGRIACGRCRSELQSLDICERCLFVKIKGAFVDSRDKWLRDRGIADAEERRRFVSRVVTFVVPGAGHILGGRVIVGALVQWVFLFGVLGCFAARLLVPETALLGSAQGLIELMCGAAAALAYLAGAVDIMVRG